MAAAVYLVVANYMLEIGSGNTGAPLEMGL